MEWKKRLENGIPLAVGVAFLPPLWAVLSELLGISFGWAALACGSVYVSAGSRIKNAGTISGGFFMGAVWGLLATKILQTDILPHRILLFVTLCIMGAACVILGVTVLYKVVYIPAWLGGWAVALGVFSASEESLGAAFVKLTVAMLSGVWYIGVFNGIFQKNISEKIRRFQKK